MDENGYKGRCIGCYICSYIGLLIYINLYMDIYSFRTKQVKSEYLEYFTEEVV